MKTQIFSSCHPTTTTTTTHKGIGLLSFRLRKGRILVSFILDLGGRGAPCLGPAQQKKLFQILPKGRAERVGGIERTEGYMWSDASVGKAGEVSFHVPWGKGDEA